MIGAFKCFLSEKNVLPATPISKVHVWDLGRVFNLSPEFKMPGQSRAFPPAVFAIKLGPKELNAWRALEVVAESTGFY